MFHAKIKHVDVKYQFIRDLIEDKKLQLVKAHMVENSTDLLTKGFSRESFECYCKLLSVG